MTEIPEHLLARSKARKAAASGDASAATAPSASAAVEKAASTEAAATTAAAPAVPEPKAEDTYVAPHIQAELSRPKIPVWALAVLAFLPVFAVMYALTNDKASPKEAGPLALGTETYSRCASCHGATGGGGVGPGFAEVTTVFPNIADQLEWVMKGTDGFKADGKTSYGATNKPFVGVMPGWAKDLNAKELIAVVRHEREGFAKEKFDPAKEYPAIQKMIDEKFPDKSAEFKAAIEEWKNLPPDL
jgi:mono/diheme cytochrome c family protein